MRIYIQFQGERAWRAVENGWSPPIYEKGNLKNKEDWTEEEIKQGGYNSKAINVIFCAMNNENFKLICATNIAKSTGKSY